MGKLVDVCPAGSVFSPINRLQERGGGKMALIVGEALPAGMKPPAVDDGMRTSTGGKFGFGASASLLCVTKCILRKPPNGFSYHAKAGQTRLAVIDPGRSAIPVLRSIFCSTLRTLASLGVWFYICLHGETSLLSLILQIYQTLIYH